MKKYLSILSLLFLIMAANSAQAQYQLPYFDSAETKVRMEGLLFSTNFISNFDATRARIYINEDTWLYALNAQDKEAFINLSADYFKYHIRKSAYRPNVRIYGGQSGKLLAEWVSVYQGFGYAEIY